MKTRVMYLLVSNRLTSSRQEDTISPSFKERKKDRSKKRENEYSQFSGLVLSPCEKSEPCLGFMVNRVIWVKNIGAFCLAGSISNTKSTSSISLRFLRNEIDKLRIKI